MEELYKYKSLASPGTAELKDRGSRFLAYASMINSAQDVKEKMQTLKKEHPKANHYCFAYRIGTDGNSFRSGDDGEPAGSAGKQILGQIDSAGITNVLVVVVRYFGGTLLGIPGLIAAYKTVAANALQQPLTEKWIEEMYEITYNYPEMNLIIHLLKECAATIYKQDLQLFCVATAGIPKKHSSEYVQRLSEIRGVTVSALKNKEI